MIDGWQWDSTLFKGASAYYERGRLPYAPGFVEKLTAVLGLDGSARLLDVGCGPGIVTLALAPCFAEVIGVDPDEDMLAEAARQAARRKVVNARWVAARAEDLRVRGRGQRKGWQFLVGGRVVGFVHVDERAAGLKHRQDSGGDSVSIRPIF